MSDRDRVGAHWYSQGVRYEGYITRESVTGREARAAAEAQARQALQAVDLSLPLTAWLADQLMRFRAAVLRDHHCACCPNIGDLHREYGGSYECWKGSD